MCVASPGAPRLPVLGQKMSQKGAHPLSATEQLRLKPRPQERYCCSGPSLGQLQEPREWDRWEQPGYDGRSSNERFSPVLSPVPLSPRQGRSHPLFPFPTSASRTLHQGGCPCSRPKAVCPKRQEGQLSCCLQPAVFVHDSDYIGSFLGIRGYKWSREFLEISFQFPVPVTDASAFRL